MSVYDENELLIDALGQYYDNFGEPIPWVNHPSVLRGFTLAFWVLSWLAVSFRLYVRTRVVRSAGWDDLFVFLYLICGTIGSAALIVSIQFGTGQHLLLLTFGQVGRYLFTFYILNGFLTLAATFIKLSLLFQYLRIFERGTWPYRVSLTCLVFVSLWGTTFAVLAFFPCTNISDFWYSPPTAHCWGYGSNVPSTFTGTFITHTTLNMFFDLVILAIPMNLYWQPTIMVMKARFGLLALLLMGAVVNFLSIWRLQTIIQYQAGWYPTHDPTWYGPISLLLGVLEIQVASVLASVPIFWPVLKPFFGAIFVTHEINVQVQQSSHDQDQDAILEHPYGSKPPSHGSHWRTPSNNSNLSHHRGESETELAPITKTPSHYDSDFVRDQVDPLRENRAAPTSIIRSESQRNKRTWYRV
ncbi:hypothetical protein GQ53DRAFT_831013 [Thozetella sp. PMI_491]|nr:hypothetical protein GQ53DRAFT_831013 [Thozetella sp. PMI_491]